MKKNKNYLNFIIGIISQLLLLVLGFIIPKIIMSSYGSDENGLITMASQIFSYMALLETGIGQSARNSLYPYIKSNDKKNISHILSISKKYYNKISIIYGFCVIILSTILPFIIKTNVSYIDVFLIIFLEGIAGVINFYLVQNLTTILIVDGKTFVNSIGELASRFLFYIIKIALALFKVRIAFIQIGFIVGIIVKTIVIKSYVKKRYSWIKYDKVNSNEKLKDRNSYILTEIASTIFSSTDMILLSIFCSTSLASVYSIYNMIYSAITILINAGYQAIIYLLSQTYFEDKEKYKKMHDLFNSIFLTIATSLISTAYILTIPFVKLYTANINDINYIYNYFPILFSLIQLLSWSRYVSGNLSGISGYAKQTSYISIAEAILNLILSIILVNLFGITGVLIGTLASLPLKVIYLNYIADIKVMKRTPFHTIKIISANFFVFLVIVFINSFFLKICINNYLSFILYGFVLLLIIFLLTFTVNVFVNKDLLKIKKIIKE